MKTRLQKILSERGVASRRKAEELILAGLVTCNGVVSLLGDSADPETDIIFVNGKPLPEQQGNVYIMLHKPKGYVTTLSDEKGRRDVSMLVSDCGRRVYPVGRLDMDSEGLLLLTDDGDFANTSMHPKHQVDKIYRVSVTGYSEEAVNLLKQPIVLDGYKIRPPKVVLVEQAGQSALLEITIHEGRNRQVRRMCARAGMKVKRLIRIGEGELKLGQLPAGKWRYLTEEELRGLKTKV